MTSNLDQVAVKTYERPTQASRRAESADRVIRAAIRLFAEKGYSGTTLAEIGEAAGYSRGIVRERFGSRERLFEIVLESIQEVFNTVILTAIAGRNGTSKILAFGEAYLVAVERIPTEMNAIYRLRAEAATGEPQFREKFQDIDQWFRDIVRAGLDEARASGEVQSSLDPAHATILIVGMLRGTVLQWLMSPSEINPADMKISVSDMIERMIGLR
jgi:AcrR family transcriptional regulator